MPQPRKHEHGAARVAAHRSRQAREGRQRLDVTVSTATAARLRAEAAARGVTLGEALEAMLGATDATTATTATMARTTTAKAATSTRKAPSRAGKAKAGTVPDTTAPAPTGAAETAATDQAGPEAPNGMATTATTTATSQAPTRRTRRRCPRSGDPGVETRHRDGWDTFAVIVDGHQVGTVTKARAGWRGETAAGHTVEGRVATAAVNRVLKAAHQSGLLEANAGGA